MMLYTYMNDIDKRYLRRNLPKDSQSMYDELDRREVRLMLVVISMTLVDFVKVSVKLSQKHFSKP